MNRQTIQALMFIEKRLEIIAHIYQHNKHKNEWLNFYDEQQTWGEWSNSWFDYLERDVAAYGAKMYWMISRCRIEPIHVF